MSWFSFALKDKLMVFTLLPLIFIAGVLVIYAANRRVLLARNASKEDLGELTSKCVYIIVLFMVGQKCYILLMLWFYNVFFLFGLQYTVFPLVTSVIFQTFAYDERMGKDSIFLRVSRLVRYV